MYARTKIFVSCGQRDEKEKLIAYKLQRKLTELGYEPYVAIHEQSTRSIIQNILPYLRDSEYFLFVDFRRERIMAGSEEYRGSLFTNQELAIAIYLEKGIIAFQEEGIKKLDGMLSAIQANAVPFTDKETLVNKIIAEVGKKWRTNWKNELIVEDKKTKEIQYEVVNYSRRANEPSRPTGFYHITIHNRHYSIAAKNCRAYLESYRKISGSDSGNVQVQEPIELKWKGVKTEGVLIAPQTSRKLDAIFVYEDSPTIAHGGTNYSLIDYSDYNIDIKGPGVFELVFLIFSDNFPAIKESFILKIAPKKEGLSFYRT